MPGRFFSASFSGISDRRFRKETVFDKPEETAAARSADFVSTFSMTISGGGLTATVLERVARVVVSSETAT